MADISKIKVNNTTYDIRSDKYISPDIINYEKVLNLSNSTITGHTCQKTGWYAVRSINRDTSGACSSYICKDSGFTDYLAADQGGSGTFLRSVSGWIFIPAGTVIYVRAYFTYSGELLYAPPTYF